MAVCCAWMPKPISAPISYHDHHIATYPRIPCNLVLIIAPDAPQLPASTLTRGSAYAILQQEPCPSS